MLDNVPATVERYKVSRQTVDDTWAMLREGAVEEVETVVLWLGQVLNETTAEVLAPFCPPQVAYRGPDGLAVEIPQEVLTQIIGALPRGIHILVRLHTHPSDAYHSSTDDRNMVIAHEGAISIVVPRFALGPADLGLCSVNVLERNGHWRELDEPAVKARFEIVG